MDEDATVTCFGQEFNPSTFAIAKADMMIRGGDPNNMRFGDTLSEDQFAGYKFDRIISNPPFGIDWKREQKAVEIEAKLGENGRFSAGLPKISDVQQLFVLNGLSKLAEDLTLYPQHTINVRVKDKGAVENDKDVISAIKDIEKLIGGKGRVLLRKSGTEPVVRIMVESEQFESCVEYVNTIAKVIEQKGHNAE